MKPRRIEIGSGALATPRLSEVKEQVSQAA